VLDTWAKGEHCFSTSKHGISKLRFRKKIKIKIKGQNMDPKHAKGKTWCPNHVMF